VPNEGDDHERWAVVAAGDEETRILLRGLLRLHHVKVHGEAEGATQALHLVEERRPTVLVVDVDLAEGAWTTLAVGARRAVPELRIVLVAPAARPPPAPPDGAKPDAVLLRPFRIRDFAEALGPGSVTGAPPSASAPS
jgi:hypothetical protein